MRKVHQGFTLIELMIVVAIIGILAAVGIPNYRTYAKKAKFTEVIMATLPYKTSIESAAQSGSFAALDDVDGGVNGVPDNTVTSNGRVASVTVTNGVITATGTTEVDNLTFILSAGGVTAPVQWTKTAGTCYVAGMC